MVCFQTLAVAAFAAVRKFVELGTRIIVGRGVVPALLVLYTIPAPIRGFLSVAGVTGRDVGCISFDWGVAGGGIV